MATLKSLIARKSEILEQLSGLGEMRKGSIVEQYLEAKKRDGTIVRRGPYLLYSYKEKGKTVSRRLPDSMTADRYRKQIHEYRRFEGLCEELTTTSQEICDRSRPHDQDATLSRKKKTTQVIQEAVAREIGTLIDRIFTERHREGRVELAALEGMIRDSSHRCGSIILERILENEEGASLNRTCPCGGHVRRRKYQSKTLVTVLGAVRLRRARHQCDRCGRWRVRADEVLDVVGTRLSPGLRRMMATVGAEVCFAKARELLGELAGITVTAKEVERCAEGIGEDLGTKGEAGRQDAKVGQPPPTGAVAPTLYIAMDGTGIPVVRKETKGRKGKASDGIARTREVKLGAVFTQTGNDQDGKPVRDRASTSYVGKIETAEVFGPRVYAEASRRGLGHTETSVILGDGAPWIWNLADEYFPGAIQIVDYYHAKEHLGDVSKTLYPADARQQNTWMDRMTERLWNGDMCGLIASLRAERTRRNQKAALETVIGYFEKNRHRMRYGTFREAGLFIGSGVIEAGCKAVIGKRLKQSGMHWSVRGANAIIALRCHIESGRFDGYWKDRCAA